MSKLPLCLDGSQNAEENFFTCSRGAVCIELRDGKMAACTAIFSIRHFNSYFKKNIRVTEKDYIDIYKVKSYRELLDFLNAPPPFCAYCNFKATTTNLPWKPSTKEISEWT
jgi:hypothetical protein